VQTDDRRWWALDARPDPVAVGELGAHVVTESTDPAEARDVLECVIADVPAVTQRRDLAHQMPAHGPAPVGRYMPTSILPEWVAPLGT
jgi:hypothetical protein